MEKRAKFTTLNILLLLMLPILLVALTITVTLAYYSDARTTSGTVVVGSIGTPTLSSKTVSGVVYPGNTNVAEVVVQNPAKASNASVWVAISLQRVYVSDVNLATGGAGTTDITNCFTISAQSSSLTAWKQAADGTLVFIYRGTTGADIAGQLKQGSTTSALKFDLKANPGFGSIGDKASEGAVNGWYSVMALLNGGTVKVEYKVEFLQAPYNADRAALGNTTLFAKFAGVNILT